MHEKVRGTIASSHQIHVVTETDHLWKRLQENICDWLLIDLVELKTLSMWLAKPLSETDQAH